MILKSPTFPIRAIPLSAILLIALAVHGPLLLMQLPAGSYDANTHIFFAAHYAHHWFNPWNVKWFGGFSQTTYPPLTHQWIALFSHVMGLQMAYMFVQFIAILLLPIGMYRYARLWVDEVSASYAALGSVFLGSLAMLVYQSGQLPTTAAAALILNALPFFYAWLRRSTIYGAAEGSGHCVGGCGGAPRHLALRRDSVSPFRCWCSRSWIATHDADDAGDEERASVGGVLGRAVVFAVIAVARGGPRAVAILGGAAEESDQPDADSARLARQLPSEPLSGINFWIIPMGAMILAIPYIVMRGSADAPAAPVAVGLVCDRASWLGRHHSGRQDSAGPRLPGPDLRALHLLGDSDGDAVRRPAGGGVDSALPAEGGGGSCHCSSCNHGHVGRMDHHPSHQQLAVQCRPGHRFLNRDDHAQFRYITLGFGSNFAKVSTYANAGSVDGDYNSARLLPEMTAYGAGQLYNSKYYGTSGMESLRAVLKHANQYGLKYIFVRDRYYEPLLAFAGWRQAESYDNGNVTLWTKEDVPPAKTLEFVGFMPTAMEGLLWGTLPVASSLLALFLVLLLPERRRVRETLEFPAPEVNEPMVLREAK